MQTWLTRTTRCATATRRSTSRASCIADPLNQNRLRSRRPQRHDGRPLRAHRRARAASGRRRPAPRRALRNVQDLDYVLTDRENGALNPLGVNCLRTFPVYGNVCWGARTLDGADQQASEWKYVPVRRLALFIEESLYRGTKWVVFEPNDEPLWAQIRLNVGAFMHDLFRQGAFQGADAARGLLRQVRQGDDDPDRHQPRHRQHRRRLRAAEAGRVRGHQDPADRRPDPRRKRGERPWPSSPSTRTRFDPYKNFKFRVKWDGRYVAGVSKVSALKRTTEVVEHREGGDPSTSRKSPGRTKYEADHARARRHPRPRVRGVGQQGVELRRRPGRGGRRSTTSARTSSSRCYNEAGQMVHRLQGLPLLGLGVPGAARPRRQRQRRRDPDAQARERGLGARRERDRARRAQVLMGEMIEVVLPAGFERDGVWRRRVWLRPWSGLDEASRRRRAYRLRCVTHDGALGALPEARGRRAVTPDLVRALTVGDREALLLHLRRITLGERLACVLTCPACGEPMDLDLGVSDLLVPPVARTIGRTTVPASRTAIRVFGSGSGFPRERIRKPPRRWSRWIRMPAERLVLRRCVIDVMTDDGRAIGEVPVAVARELPGLMAELDPQAELRLEVACPACGCRSPRFSTPQVTYSRK